MVLAGWCHFARRVAALLLVCATMMWQRGGALTVLAAATATATATAMPLTPDVGSTGTAAASPLCRAIASFVSAGDAVVPILDAGSIAGLPALTNFAFVQENCAAGTAGNNAEYDSGWVASTATAFELAGMTVSAPGLQCRQSFNATSETPAGSAVPQLTALSVSSACKGAVSGTTAAGAVFSAAVEASVFKTLSTAAATAAGFAVPLNETSSFPVFWESALTTTLASSSSSSSSSRTSASAANTTVYVVDYDLFDGRPAVVFTGAVANPDAGLVADAAAASAAVATLALVLTPLSGASSSLPASFRGAMLDASALSSASTAGVTVAAGGTMLLPESASGSEAGVIAVSMAACGSASAGAAECPALMGTTLVQLVASGLNISSGGWADASGDAGFAPDPCVQADLPGVRFAHACMHARTHAWCMRMLTPLSPHENLSLLLPARCPLRRPPASRAKCNEDRYDTPVQRADDPSTKHQ